MINKKILNKFLKLAGERLSGEWVLIGGSVLPLLGVEVRSTVDIDFIGKTAEQQMQTLQLMDIAVELGLPVETINQAGAYYLTKIKNYEGHLNRIHVGKEATIYAPDLFLFLQLKVDRLSESDFTDCMEYIKYNKKNKCSKELLDQCKILLKSKLKSNKHKDRILEMLNKIEKE